MTESTSPSPRFDALVGEEHAPATRRALVQALIRGNDQAKDAFEFSAHSDGYTYGTNRWRFCLAEVGLAMARMEGARQLSPRNSRMWKVGQAVCYPVCYAEDVTTDVRLARINASPLRRDLFARIGRLSPYVQLELALDLDADIVEPDIEDGEGEIDLDEGEDEASTVAEPGDPPRMVVVAYASNRHAGLLRVHVGEAVLDSRGRLLWSWCEELPVDRPVRGGLTLLTDIEPPAFADAPEPELDLAATDVPDVTPADSQTDDGDEEPGDA